MAFFVCNLWSFFLNVLCNVDLKILINGNVTLTSNLSWNWSHTIFQTFLVESFCFLPRLSGFSTVWNSLYFFTMVRKVETGTKNCLDMALYLFQFLWATIIRVLRSELSSSPLAMLTPMLLEEECQLLQMRKLSYEQQINSTVHEYWIINII